jgi:sugar-specific transcriptional regulator TrmB
MEKQRDSLFSSWASVKLGGPTSPIEKFLAVRGTNNVNITISSMMEQANKELRMIMTPLDVIRAERLDHIETLSRLKKNSTFRCRVLTHISKEDINIVKNSAKLSSTKHVAIEWRHIGSESFPLPRIMIKDEEEVFILQSEETTVPPRWDNGLWTNSKLITNVTSRLFEELWIKSANANERIAQIDVGRSLGKSVTISDASSAYKLFVDTLAQTSNEIITINPSINSFTHLGKQSIQSLSMKGVNVRAMFPIDAANIDDAIALSKYCKVRDPSVNYLAATLIDKKHMFRFGTKVPDAGSIDPLKYFQDMYYSNEREQVEKMAEMLEGLWQRSVEILDIKSKLTRKG